VRTVKSLLTEIGEKVVFQLDPEVDRVLLEGEAEDGHGLGWAPRGGDDLYAYDDFGRRVSRDEQRRRPKNDTQLGPHDSVFRSVGRHAPQVQGKVFTFPTLHLDQLSSYTDS